MKIKKTTPTYGSDVDGIRYEITQKLHLTSIGAGCSQEHPASSGILITLACKENDLILLSGEYLEQVEACINQSEEIRERKVSFLLAYIRVKRMIIA